MSRVLDDIIMDDVAKSCPESFLDFHKCMQSPKITDKRECLKYQAALQRCVREEVPSFQKIQKNCVDVIRDYQGCLMNNKENYSSKCLEQLKNLRNCAADQVNADANNGVLPKQ